MKALGGAWLHPKKLNMGAGKTTFSSGGMWDSYTSLQNVPIYKCTNLPAPHSRHIFTTLSHAGMLSQKASLSLFFFSCGVDDFWMQKHVSHSSHRNNNFIIVKCSALFTTSESPTWRPVIYWWIIYSTSTYQLNKQNKVQGNCKSSCSPKFF